MNHSDRLHSLVDNNRRNSSASPGAMAQLLMNSNSNIPMVVAHMSPKEIQFLTQMQGYPSVDSQSGMPSFEGLHNMSLPPQIAQASALKRTPQNFANGGAVGMNPTMSQFPVHDSFGWDPTTQSMLAAQNNPVQAFADGGGVNPFASLQYQRAAAKGLGPDSQMAKIPLSFANHLDSLMGGPDINPMTNVRQYGFFDDILGGIGSMFSPIMDTVKDIGSGLGGLVNDVIPGAGNMLGGITGALSGPLGGMLDEVAPEVGLPLQALGGIMGGGGQQGQQQGQNPFMGMLSGMMGGGQQGQQGQQSSPLMSGLMGAMQGLAGGQGLQGALQGALGGAGQSLMQSNPQLGGMMQQGMNMMNAYNQGGLGGLVNQGMNMMGQSNNPFAQQMSNMYGAYQQGGMGGLMNQGMNMMNQYAPQMSPYLQQAGNMYNAYNQGGLGGLASEAMNTASQYMPQSEGPPNPYLSALKNAGMGAYNAYNQGGMNMGNMMQGALGGAATSMMQNPDVHPYAQMAGGMYNMMQNPQMYQQQPQYGAPYGMPMGN